MSLLNKAIDAISAQQPKERTAVWMVGEQLKDIIIDNPSFAEIVLQDLEVAEMSIANCEKKIKAFADKNKKGNFACVIPSEADRIIREFYGLHADAKAKDNNVIDLSDFFGGV